MYGTAIATPRKDSVESSSGNDGEDWMNGILPVRRKYTTRSCVVNPSQNQVDCATGMRGESNVLIPYL